MVGLFFFPFSFWDPHSSSSSSYTACISSTGSMARRGVEGYVCPRCKLRTWKRISLAELLSPSPPPPGQSEWDCCPFHIPQIREAGVTIVPLFRQEDRQPLPCLFIRVLARKTRKQTCWHSLLRFKGHLNSVFLVLLNFYSFGVFNKQHKFHRRQLN